jgi:cellulose synthase/poly-beta-1,6-N-acetylglucosamine synthase-like glycosyltransferase
VIVPAYGVAGFLAEALSSLWAQSFVDWEVVVVDDGDRIGVAAAFAPFGSDARMRLLQTDNAGVSTARNRAVAAARADVIAFLDGDDLYERDYLARMLQALQDDPALGFVTCDAQLFGAGVRRARLYSEAHPIQGPLTLERVLTRQVNVFTAAVVRRSAFQSVGGFDAHLRAAEDLDLWIRLLALGWRGAVVPAPLVRYRRREGSLSSNVRALLAGCCAVYAKAAAMLAGRPEAAAAQTVGRHYAQRLAWAEGEALIIEGRVSAGLALLRDAGVRSRRWRLAIAMMRRAPWVAAPLLRLRRWLPEPSSG